MKYIPQKNPRPKYFLTVQGHIDPKLMKTVKITWVLDFETSNQTDTHCEDVVSYFEGAIFPKDKYLKITTKPDKNGNFKQKLPLDYYSPGYCGWGLNNIGFNLNKVKDIAFAFVNNAAQTKSIANAKLVCKNKDCVFKSFQNYNENQEITTTKNYIFNFIIKPGETHD